MTNNSTEQTLLKLVMPYTQHRTFGDTHSMLGALFTPPPKSNIAVVYLSACAYTSSKMHDTADNDIITAYPHKKETQHINLTG